ncbi:MAG: sigma-70 family RNA polymerase sigma factor [Solirubrobacterales bacterium]|nr:sigma-70 family RNA polymerase sigma factor [Solirubrobacterales bacterium]
MVGADSFTVTSPRVLVVRPRGKSHLPYGGHDEVRNADLHQAGLSRVASRRRARGGAARILRAQRRPAVRRRRRAAPGSNGDFGPRRERRHAHRRRPLRRHEGGVRRLLHLPGRQSRRSDRGRRADPGGPARWRYRSPPGGGAIAQLEQVFREQWGRVLASLIGFLGDFDLAEEAAQEAFAIAVERWPREGIPRNPAAWLLTTARHRAIDRIRRQRTLVAKTRLLEVPEAVVDELDETVIEDERLELIFTCCHPALALEAQVALTLRALGGLTTEEIARAFLVGEETMKRRLSRAKAKIKATRIPFAVPADHLLPDRVRAVLAVVYLIYNAGYGGRVDLAAEAIRLGRLLTELMPDEPEVHGLVALMLIQHARRRARFAGNDLVLLRDQDRALWNAGELAEGRQALDRAIALRGRGTYVLQAAIASLQSESEIDWRQIAALYEQLVRLTSSPVVELNRAVAVAETGATEAALEIVEALELDDYQYLHSTRGELLQRLGRYDEARAAFARALALAGSEPERRFLAQRMNELRALRGPS